MLKARYLIFLLACSLAAEKLTSEQRMEIIRGLMAEYATAKSPLPRSKKALEFRSDGTWDREQWADAGRKMGPAARPGDLVQITKVDIGDKRIVFEINGGAKGGRKWYERIEVGMGTRTTPISQPGSVAPSGTTIALVFDEETPGLPPSEFKKMLAPLLDFELRTATEQLIDQLPPEIKAAVEEKRAIEGMDRDQVVLAMGKPRTKVREMKDGMETEDWIYGLPPGKITFVTFADGKVVKVNEAYAGLGGQTMPTMKPPL